GATLFATLLAAFQVLLHRQTEEDELIVGVPTAGRDSAAFAGVVGYFVNLLPLRATLIDRPAFSAFLERMAAGVAGALAHQALPFPLIAETAAERLRPQRDPSRPPLVQATFTLQQAHRAEERAWSAFALGEEGGRAELGGLAVESVRLPERRVQFELMLMAAETEDGLTLSMQVNADLFDPATAARLAGQLRNVLQGIAADAEQPVAALPLLAAAERHQVALEWNDTAIDWRTPSRRGLHGLIEAQAVRTPTAVAVKAEGAELTYAELDERADRLAFRLRHLGV